jgi:hypothetical protein
MRNVTFGDVAHSDVKVAEGNITTHSGATLPPEAAAKVRELDGYLQQPQAERGLIVSAILSLKKLVPELIHEILAARRHPLDALQIAWEALIK